MHELTRPFVRLWTWIEVEGGFPGQIFLASTIIILILGFCTWLSNKR